MVLVLDVCDNTFCAYDCVQINISVYFEKKFLSYILGNDILKISYILEND